jgi:serine/threonine protein kinase
MLTRTGLEEWNAPEMLDGSYYDEKVDIWGAGCIMYFILSSEQPFLE